MMPSLKAGDIVAGKYMLERVIGRGGVGVVASAQHLMLRQRVALKFLRQELASEPEVIGRFLREAQSAAQIRGEHVARVMDAGTLDSGAAFLVMEYLEGRDLAAVLKEDGPLPIDDAVDYLVQACEGIAEAHALGIVHRDLKPANLFLTRAPDGSAFVKVLDFGLSKVIGSESRTALTADHHVIGSPHFMSPEQMRSSRDCDTRSDVWALGVVLYTFLTGRVPFDGRFLTEICAAILGGDMKPLRDHRPDVPVELEAVVLRCLRTSPDERYGSVAALASALAPFTPDRTHAREHRIGRVLEGNRTSEFVPVAEPPTPLLTTGAHATTTAPPLWDDSTVAARPSGRPSAAVPATIPEPSDADPTRVRVPMPGYGRGNSDRPPWAEPSEAALSSQDESEISTRPARVSAPPMLAPRAPLRMDTLPATTPSAGMTPHAAFEANEEEVAAATVPNARSAQRSMLAGFATAIALGAIAWSALRSEAAETAAAVPAASLRASVESATPAAPRAPLTTTMALTIAPSAASVAAAPTPPPDEPLPPPDARVAPSKDRMHAPRAPSRTTGTPTRRAPAPPRPSEVASDEDLIKGLPH